MAEYTKDDLKARCSNGTFADAALFADIIDSLKGRQAAVSDPSAAGASVTFIATITQDAEGKITVTKKTVNFSGYQTTEGMSAYQTVAAMNDYQIYDVQVKGDVNVDGSLQSITTTVDHNKKHYPTVRLINENGLEIDRTKFSVVHIDEMSLEITLDGSLNNGDPYWYILD